MGLLSPVSAERVVHAPAERVFDLLARPSQHRLLDGSGTVREPYDGPERLALGDRFGMGMKAGAPYRMVNEVVEFEEGRRIAWQPRPDHRGVDKVIGGRIWRWELEPLDAGRTLVRETWDISQERVPPLLLPLKPVVKPQLERSLDRLERALA
ncbi:MAG TPA: SRPBCC family protein [Mycobacteriales bacterium]|nr:SRPBCC family protein [Mycobacteriales bacterium]